MGIEPVIKPRRNARTDRGPPCRRTAVRTIRDYGYDIWRRISAFKSIFGEEVLHNKPRWMKVEMIQKAFIYNLLPERGVNLRRRRSSGRRGYRA